MNIILIKPTLVAFIVAVLSSCGNSTTPKDSGETSSNRKAVDSTSNAAKQVVFTTEQYKLADIGMGGIESRNLSNVIKLNGIIDVEPSSMAMVSAPLGGYIKTSGLLPGQAIKKGQVLATIENAEFITMQQEYLESQGKLEYLQQEYDRQRKLREEEVNAAKTFQQVASDIKVLQAKINGLQQRISLAGINTTALKNGIISRTANLYAPISGYIKTSNVNIGKYVNPTDVLFELVNTNDLHLALNAYEKDLPEIVVGQTVKFSLAKENNFNRMAKVFLIGQATGDDQITPVHCHLTKQNETDLLPGMYAKAWIETGAKNEQAVPTEAIVQIEGKDYLIQETGKTAENYQFTLIPIKKGIAQEGYTAVEFADTSGIRTMRIVVKNAYAILSAYRNASEEE